MKKVVAITAVLLLFTPLANAIDLAGFSWAGKNGQPPILDMKLNAEGKLPTDVSQTEMVITMEDVMEEITDLEDVYLNTVYGGLTEASCLNDQDGVSMLCVGDVQTIKTQCPSVNNDSSGCAHIGFIWNPTISDFEHELTVWIGEWVPFDQLHFLMMHETIHGLGIGHERVQPSLMAESPLAPNSRRTLQAVEINALKALYPMPKAEECILTPDENGDTFLTPDENGDIFLSVSYDNGLGKGPQIYWAIIQLVYPTHFQVIYAEKWNLPEDSVCKHLVFEGNNLEILYRHTNGKKYKANLNLDLPNNRLNLVDYEVIN